MAETEQFDITTLDETAKDDSYFDVGLSPSSTFNDPTYAEQKAAKYHFALGEDSPGQDALKGNLQNGELAALREATAERENAKYKAAKQDVITRAVSDVNFLDDDNKVKAVQQVAKLQKEHNPDTILDEIYGRKFAETSLAMTPGEELWKKALNESPDEVLDGLDGAAEHIAKNEMVADSLKEVEAKWGDRSILSKAGKYFEDQFWWWSWSHIHEAFPNHPMSTDNNLLRTLTTNGAVTESLLSYLHTLKPAQFKKEWSEGINKLAERNPLWAYWMTDVYHKYSKTDAEMTTVGAVANPLLVVSNYGLAKAAAKVTVATTKDAIHYLRPSSALITDEKIVAQQKQAIEQTLKKPIEQATPTEVQHVVDTATAIQDTIKAAKEPTVERMTATVGDLDKAADAAVHAKAVQKFKEQDPFGDAPGLANEVPSLFNPSAAAGDPGSLGRARAQKLVDSMHGAAAKLLDTATSSSDVVRMPEEAIQAALEETKKQFITDHPTLADALLDTKHGGDFRYITPDEQLPNVYTGEVRLGMLQEQTSAKSTPKSTPVVDKVTQQIQAEAFGRKKKTPDATAPKPAEPKLTGNPFVDSVNEVTGKKGRMLVRDLYDEMKRAGTFKGTLGDFKAQVHDMFRKNQLKVSPHKGKIPDAAPSKPASIKVNKPEKRYRVSHSSDGDLYSTVSPAHLKEMTDRLVTEPLEPVETVFKRGVAGITLSKEQKQAADRFLSNDFDTPSISLRGTASASKDGVGSAGASWIEVARSKIREHLKKKGNKLGYIGATFKTANDAIAHATWHEIAHTVIPQGKLTSEQWEKLVDAYAYRKTYGKDRPSKEPTYSKNTADKYIKAKNIEHAHFILSDELAHTDELKEAVDKGIIGDELIAYAYNHTRDVLLNDRFADLSPKTFVDAITERVNSRVKQGLEAYEIRDIRSAHPMENESGIRKLVNEAFNKKKKTATAQDIQAVAAEAKQAQLKEPLVKGTEEGNFAAETSRDVGRGVETLRNRIIDSEGIDLPADKFHSARKYHYVEPSGPVAKEAPNPRKTAFFKAANPSNLEELHESLSNLQRLVANTGNEKLYHKLGRMVEGVEQKIKSKDSMWLGAGDPRTMPMDAIGSPYEDVKRAVPKVQQPATNVGRSPEAVAGGWELTPKELNEIKLRVQRKWPELEGQALQKKTREVKEALEAKQKARMQPAKSTAPAPTAPASKKGRKVIDVPEDGEIRPGSRRLWEGHYLREDHDAIERETYDFLKAVGKYDDSFKKGVKPDAATLKETGEVVDEVAKHVDALEKSGKSVVEHVVGKPDATLFKTRTQAAYWAREIYGLSKNSFRVKQQGNGFYVSVPLVVDETHPNARALMATGSNQTRTGWFNSLLGMARIRGASEIVSDFQDAARKTASYGPNKVREGILKADDEFRSLPAKQKDELNEMFRANRDKIVMDENGDPIRGEFYKTFGELEREFHKRFQKLPTDGQIAAYFEYVRNYDLEWVLKNVGLHTEISRLGLEKTRAFFHINNDGQLDRFPTKWFSSKKTDTLPLHEDGGGDWGVWVYDSNLRKGSFYLRSRLTADVLADVDTKTAQHGYSIRELGNPLEKPLQNVIGSNETVNFIVVKDAEVTRYPWSVLPRRPGGHIEYVNRFFVAQPIIRRSDLSGTMRHIYEGDMPLLNVSTRAEAKKMSDALDEARRLLKQHGEKSDVFKDYVFANTPFEPEQFSAFFKETVDEVGNTKPPKMHIDDQITWKFSGRQTVEMSHMRHVESSKEYPGYFNAVRSKYNLFANGVDKKYVGARDPDLPAVGLSHAGGAEKPMFLDKPPLLDPMPALEKSLSHVTRSKYLNDYKVSAMETFIQEFHPVMKTPLEDLRRNPTYYLHNPVWDTQTTEWNKLQAAKNSRRAIINLLGTNSELGDGIHWLQQSVGDLIYHTRGKETADFLANNKLLPLETNPLKYMRSVAFGLQFLGNLTQTFVQATGVTTCLGIAGPVKTFGATPKALLARKLMMTENPDVIAGNARHLGKFGIDPANFIQAYEELNKSGFRNIGGEYNAFDNYFDPKMFKGSKAATWIDKGYVFMTEGDRFNRLLAWFTAFDEWKAKNPNKIIGNPDRTTILQRADLLSGDMSRAGMASVQHGFGSIPTQFWSYSWRLSELTTGTRLTMPERARLIGTYSALFGLPAGLSLTTFYPWYDDIKQSLMNNGVKVDDAVMRGLYSGITGTMTHMITGEDYNIGQRLGPGLQVFKDIKEGQKGVLELAMGASGNIVGKALGSIPGVDTFNYMFSDEAPAPSQADVIDMARSLAGFSYAYKSYFLATAGKFLNRRGGVVQESDAPLTDAVMHGLFGLTNQKVVDAYIMKLSNKQQKEADNIAINEAARYHNLATKAWLAGDTETGDNYKKKVLAVMKAADLPQQRVSDIAKRAIEMDAPLYDKVQKGFIERAHPEDIEKRREMFMTPTETK